MSNVYVNYTGNGYAYVDNPTPNPGDPFTLYAYEDPGETLDDITAVEEHGYSVAMATTNVQTLTYNAIWGSYITINVIFSGGTPPPPVFPAWLIALLSRRQKKRIHKNY